MRVENFFVDWQSVGILWGFFFLFRHLAASICLHSLYLSLCLVLYISLKSNENKSHDYYYFYLTVLPFQWQLQTHIVLKLYAFKSMDFVIETHPNTCKINDCYICIYLEDCRMDGMIKYCKRTKTQKKCHFYGTSE